MNVHNLMEELVYSGVNDLFDAARENKSEWLVCDCAQCRLDTICYVLNRVPPRYIKSARGLAHTQNDDAFDRPQLLADINRIALEGMKQVLSSRRPHTQAGSELPVGPVFNVPTLVGRILDGQTFEPVRGLSVKLLLNGALAESINSSWENPCVINEHTPGTFTFWPKPIAATAEGEKRVFSFEIAVDREGYDPIRYFFELGVASESVIRTAYTSEHSYILPDLHFFRLDDADSPTGD